jgi:hypothetical protein
MHQCSIGLHNVPNNCPLQPRDVPVVTKCPLLELATSTSSQYCPIQDTRDYVKVFVVNQHGEALVMENAEQGRAWGSWQIIGRYVERNEDPLTAVQLTLLHHTGYIAKEWIYLGSFATHQTALLGAGHFFLARQPCLATPPDPSCASCGALVRWAPISQIKQALLDGRIAVVSHVIATTLALTLSE